MSVQWFLEIEAEDGDGNPLPRNVGPFASGAEAEKWACRNVANGEWVVAPLAPADASSD